MAVRNFYLVADVDGRKKQLTGGPRKKDGGMTIQLFQLDRGKAAKALDIYCCVNYKGELVTTVTYPQLHMNTNREIVTER